MQAIALLLRELGEKQEVHLQIVSMLRRALAHTNTRTYCSQVCDSLINYVTVNNDAISPGPGASKDKEERHPE